MFSKLDEKFRVFATMPSNVSEAGADIRQERVFGGTLKRSPALKKQMSRDCLQVTTQIWGEHVRLPLITVPRAEFEPFFIRLAKGLLTALYPNVDYFAMQFEVRQWSQFAGSHKRFAQLTSLLTADQRGDGVFRFWHKVFPEEQNAGVWLLQFYDAALFLVMHRPSTSQVPLIAI
jgi:hypothetical protein